jgi:ribonuclease BN (tRNA processing enzyme)
MIALLEFNCRENILANLESGIWNMKFTVLGSGSSIPHAKRSSSAYWLETESGTVLLDFSAAAIQRMAQENCDWANLEAVWLSHFHLDHVGGLAPFLFGTRHAPEMQSRTKPLIIYGAKGLHTLLKSFDEANDYKLFEQPFPVEVREVEPLEKFEILPGVQAATMKTPHTAESLAIYIRDRDNKSLVYSSDTGFEKSLGAFARDVDLFVLECSFVKNKPAEKHLELAEAMFLVRYAKPKKAMLTHFYAEWDAVDFQSEVKRFAPPCDVIEARDGLSLEV